MDGVFRAVSKNKVPNPPDNLFIGYFYSNNKDQKYNQKQLYGNNNYNNRVDFSIILRLILFIFIIIIALLVFDFFTMYRKVKRENKIEIDKCNEEYMANKCDQININEGPILNDFCYEKKKCKENEIFFHEVLIRYIRNVIFVSIKGINIFNILIILFTILIIFRIFY